VTEDIETSTTQPPADAPPGGAENMTVQARVAAFADERLEVAIGAAFAGGLLAAMILRRLVR
jgi:hypothetical protein